MKSHRGSKNEDVRRGGGGEREGEGRKGAKYGHYVQIVVRIKFNAHFIYNEKSFLFCFIYINFLRDKT